MTAGRRSCIQSGQPGLQIDRPAHELACQLATNNVEKLVCPKSDRHPRVAIMFALKAVLQTAPGVATLAISPFVQCQQLPMAGCRRVA